MTTLAANSTVTLTLTAYDSVTIESRGPVLVEAVSGLGVTAGKLAELQGTRTLGPYTEAGSLKLTSYGQTIEYQVADGSNPSSNAQFARNGDGSVAGLVADSVIAPLGCRVSATRKEARAPQGSPTTLIANLVNPSSTIAYTSAPAAINVSFGEGEVWHADQLKVYDATGTAISFQVEDAKHPATGASLATYADGSLRSMVIWVLASLTAGQTKRYTIEVYPYALGQSFTKAVTYTAVSGTIDELATSAIRTRFESAQGWNMRRYQDIGNASFDLFAGANGVHSSHQISSGVGKNSFTAADITSLSHGVLNAASFGNGVVFQDYQSVHAWAAQPDLTVTTTYRVFADGSVFVTSKTVASAAIASAAKQNFLKALVGSTGITSATVAANYYMTFDYAGSSFMALATDLTRDYPVKTTETHTAAAVNESTTIARAGWTGTTVIPAGAFFINRMWIRKITTGDGANEFIRLSNPIKAFASTQTNKPARYVLGDAVNALISEAITTIATEPQWGGVSALLGLSNGTLPAAQALGVFQAWAASISLTPQTSSSWIASWNASTGMEYTGRNAQVLWWLREAFVASGDTANQSLVESYIHAFADFAVSAEAASGGVGTVKLRNSAPSAAWNAATSAMSGLARSLAITANAGRQTVYDRILAAYVAGKFAGQKWNYDSTNSVTTEPSFHYYAYQTFELACAKAILTATTLPAGSLTSYIRQSILAEGIVDDNIVSLQYRRGRESTQYYAAACLVLLDGDYLAAYEAVRHVEALPQRYQATGIDGFGSTDISDVAMDVRALAELKLAELI